MIPPAGVPGQGRRAQQRGKPVADKLNDLIDELTLANRILANEGVLDAFGHVSVRHPTDPGRYFLSRSRSPLVIEADDILDTRSIPSRCGRRRCISMPSA